MAVLHAILKNDPDARGKKGLAGEIVAAVDDRIRYTPRKVGYRGGAAPAEVVIPVIILLPSQPLLPAGWHLYDRAGHAPSWWSPALARPEQPPTPQQPVRPRPAPRGRKEPVPDAPALFAAAEIAPVRMSGYLAQATRLLNVDGYAVLQQTDAGRTVELNQALLRQQFLTT